jgi:hypothetical protein
MIKIFKAYFNWLFFEQSTEAKRRYEICRKCAKKKIGVCVDCGCVCVIKVRCEICECKKWGNGSDTNK